MSDADIIHPGHGNSRFVEPWEQRKARKARNAVNRSETGRMCKPRRLRSGLLIDVAFIRRAEQLYAADMSVKRIAVELGCGTNTVNRIRQEQGWPKRRVHNSLGEGGLNECTVILPANLIAAVDQRVFGRYRNRSAYIRRLIKRDLGL